MKTVNNLTFGNYYTIIWTYDTHALRAMIIKTRVFELANGKYHNLSGLARAMGLSISQVYRVRVGKRGINEKFLIGAKKAFPEYRLDELFYFSSGRASNDDGETTAPRQYHPATR